MSGSTFGGRIKLEGEEEYRASLKRINAELREVSAEMKANAESAELMAKKQELVKEKIDNQKKHIEELKTQLALAKAEYGENSAEVERWATKLANAKTTLISMEGELKNLQAEINRSGDRWINAGEKLSAYGEKLSLLSGAAAGALVGLGGLAIKAASSADEINTLSTVTGISAQELQKFAYASELVDVSQQTITSSLRKLTKNMQSAQGGTEAQAQAFEKLGVAYEDASGNLLDRQDVFDEIIDALGKVENETERSALAMTLFGKSADDLNPLIEAGSQALRDFGQEAEEAGIILDDETLASMNKLDDSIQRLKALTSQGMTAIGADLAEMLTPIAEDMIESLKKVIDWLKGLDTQSVKTVVGLLAFTAATAPVLKTLGSLVSGVGSLYKSLSTAIPIVGKMGTAISSAFSTAIASPVVAFAAAITAATVAIGALIAQMERAKAYNYANEEAIKAETEAYSELAKKQYETERAYQDNINRIDEAAQAQLAQAAICQNQLIPRLEELINKTDKTTEEQQEMKTVVGQLNNLIPDMNLSIDEQTGALSRNIDEIKEAVKAYESLAKATALSNKMVSAQENILDEQSNLRNAVTKFKALPGLSQFLSVDEATGQYKATRHKSVEEALNAYLAATGTDRQSVVEVLSQLNASKNRLSTLQGEVDQYSKDYAEIMGALHSGSNEPQKSKVTTSSDLTDTQKQSIKNWDYLHDIGEKSDQEYYDALIRIRDNYFAKDSEGWREYNLKAYKLKESVNKNLTSQDKKSAADKKKTEEEKVKTLAELYVEDKANLDEQLKYKLISEEEYYAALERLRDKYYNGLNTSQKRQLDYDIDQHSKAVKQAKFETENTNSYNWINDRLLYQDWDKFDTNLTDSIDRIQQRLYNAFDTGDIDLDTYTKALDELKSASADWFAQMQDYSQGWIDDRNFYGDWDKYATDEAQSYKRMLARAEDFYNKGLIDYRTYINARKQLSRSLYTAEQNMQQESYKIAENELNRALSEQRTIINNKIEALRQELSDFDDNYNEQERLNDIEELKAEAAKYRNSATIQGQEHYADLVEQIHQKQHEQERYELEKATNEKIAQLEEEYARLEEEKNAKLEELATKVPDKLDTLDNTISSAVETVSSVIGTAMQALSPLGGSVSTNSATNNNQVYNINNNISDRVDLFAMLAQVFG